MVRESDRDRLAGTVTIVLGVRIDGGRLRALLLSRAPSIRAAGVLVGQSESRLHDWISGRSAPQPETLCAILRILRADLLDVLPSGTQVTLEVLRWSAGRTIGQVVEATGIGRARYSALETEHRVPTDDELARLAAFYGLPVDTVRAASRRHAEVTWVVSVPADLARAIEQARGDDETVPEAVLRLARAGLDQTRGDRTAE